MFAVLLAATTLGDPNANPVLHERLMTRLSAAVNAAADRHPRQADQLRCQMRYIELDAQIREVGAISREEASAFLLNYIQSFQQLTTVAHGLADPALDVELLATVPRLVWASAEYYRWRRGPSRDGCSLQGKAAWYQYLRESLPAVARVVGYTAVVATCRPR